MLSSCLNAIFTTALYKNIRLLQVLKLIFHIRKNKIRDKLYNSNIFTLSTFTFHISIGKDLIKF